jgi:mannose-1-phosphate guanylyltransferase
MKNIVVIMAGGSGERFWPLSRMKKPKQLLALVSEKALIVEAIERIYPYFKYEDIYIITGKLLLSPIREALPELPPENIIAEPLKRNTAPCLALAASIILAKYGNEFAPNEITISVLTSDQDIHPAENFIKTIDKILQHVGKNPVLSTIGIIPSRPETGYGYIEVDKTFNNSNEEVEINPVKCFREKPNYEQALDFIKQGNFLWNSGMFFWRLDVFIDSMKKHLPEVGNKIEEMAKLYKNVYNIALNSPNELITPIFEKFPNESIDYGLMEKAENIVVAKALFEWDDVGSWTSLERTKTIDSNGNIFEGNNIFVDTNDSIVINCSKNNEMLVSGIGLKNMVIVITDDSVMISPKDRVQDIKKCIEKIRQNCGDKWL